ncbi:putative dienelactone hydrolase [Streptosporangium becharense]|uniref:Putative dienelactone hydrolase n=1 Tax=Streptosporangium becharense TaxID=1816182 RepID=A0A7W9ME08_9ACTN|nr:lipase [Streptosporangium becharense]MBB2915331.1 putative dienelactone hydrolase [Streptosporangium becharense]MBB5816971.1 putative dienelactone hydrolase [Streptosporangium becharense]
MTMSDHLYAVLRPRPAEREPGPIRRGAAMLRRAVPAAVLGLALTAAPALAGTGDARPTAAGTTPTEGTGTGAGLTAGQAAPVRLTLPEPTGPLRIGTVSLHLVDRSRPDPWVPAKTSRELMVQLWYPAEKTTAHPRAPWLSPKVAQAVLSGLPAGTVRLPVTHGRVGAPVDRRRGPRPVVLFSHGFAADRASGTALAEDLASHGYVVATVDHTHDAAAVEFPGGRLETHAVSPPPDFDKPDDPVATKAVAVRTADTRFVMDQLTALNRGHAVDAGRGSPPSGLRGMLDLSRVGMFGHSLGGATAAATMHADPRIKAGANLDGAMFGPVLRAGLDRPFLLVGSSEHGRDNDPGWAALWSRLRGWRLELRLDGAGHSSFTDLQVLLRQHPLGLPPEQVNEMIGKIDGPRSVLVQRVYLRAFFDRHLLGRPGRLLDGPSKRWPEMRFTR